MVTTYEGPTAYQQAILVALMLTGKHIYEGTANVNKVARRRAKNKVARVSRRANRS